MIFKFKMNKTTFPATFASENEVDKEIPLTQDTIYIAIKEIHFNYHLGYDYSKYHYYFHYQLTISTFSLNLSWYNISKRLSHSLHVSDLSKLQRYSKARSMRYSYFRILLTEWQEIYPTVLYAKRDFIQRELKTLY